MFDHIQGVETEVDVVFFRVGDVHETLIGCRGRLIDAASMNRLSR